VWKSEVTGLEGAAYIHNGSHHKCWLHNYLEYPVSTHKILKFVYVYMCKDTILDSISKNECCCVSNTSFAETCPYLTFGIPLTL
jgi:hypothetical protein